MSEGGPPRSRHGYARKGQVHPLHRVWSQMLQRCSNPNDKRFKSYGKRGITVCERWLSFENFIADVGERPEGVGPTGRSLWSLDRRDNDKGYGPDNFKWSTAKEQGEHTSRNRLLTLDGVTQPLCKWAEQLGVHRVTIMQRLRRGYSEKAALTIPCRIRKG
jgi:hypothetical protein